MMPEANRPNEQKKIILFLILLFTLSVTFAISWFWYSRNLAERVGINQEEEKKLDFLYRLKNEVWAVKYEDMKVEEGESLKVTLRVVNLLTGDELEIAVEVNDFMRYLVDQRLLEEINKEMQKQPRQ